MPVTRRAPYPHKGTVARKGCQTFLHSITIGASGAVTTQDADSGVSAVKNAGAGLYDLTLPSAVKKFVSGHVTFIGTLTTGTGNQYDWETNNLDAGTKAGTIQLQFRRNDTMAVADVPSGVVIRLRIEVEMGV